jgi:hypothetical protein
MKVLLLGNSNDGGSWIGDGRKRHEIVADQLAELTGQPVDVVTKSIWPNPGLEKAVESWVEQHEPDVVYLTMLSYWFQYRSVPLRVRRLLGPLGPKVSDAGFRFAESPRWAHNAVFRGIRRSLQRTVGGDTHFTPDEVVDRITGVIRVLLRHEGLVVAIQGADGRTDYAFSNRGRRRNEQRRLYVADRMKSWCQEHHVTYENSETAVYKLDPVLARNRVGDGLHANALWHERSAGLITQTIQHALVDAGVLAPNGSESS